MRVPQHLDQLWHNGGQAAGELFRSTEGHGPQQFHGAGFGAPLVLLQGGQQAGQDQFDAVGGQLRHDRLGAVVGGLAHVLVGVAEAEEEVGQHVDDVGLKEAAQHAAELGQGEQGALAVPRILLVLCIKNSRENFKKSGCKFEQSIK